MSLYKFVITTSEIIKSGSVVRSKFATAGPYQTATPDGLGDFAVFDDIKGECHRCNSAISAAHTWNQINLREIRG